VRKPETRNPKSEGNHKTEITSQKVANQASAFGFWNWDFLRISGFGFRAFANSDLQTKSAIVPHMSPWWTVVFLGVFFIGLTKSGFGSGLGLLAVPMITLAMKHIPGRGAQAGIGFMLPLLICGDLIAVWQYRHLFSIDIIKRLLLGSIIGLVTGGLLLAWFHAQKSEALVSAVISIEIGIESIFLVGLYWWRQIRGLQKNLMKEPMRSNVTGAFAGVSSTLAHGAGPIIATYLLPLGLDRKPIRRHVRNVLLLPERRQTPRLRARRRIHPRVTMVCVEISSSGDCRWIVWLVDQQANERQAVYEAGLCDDVFVGVVCAV